MGGMGRSLPAEVSEFLVNALKSHDDDEGCDGRKEEDWREQKKDGQRGRGNA